MTRDKTFNALLFECLERMSLNTDQESIIRYSVPQHSILIDNCPSVILVTVIQRYNYTTTIIYKKRRFWFYKLFYFRYNV